MTTYQFTANQISIGNNVAKLGDIRHSEGNAWKLAAIRDDGYVTVVRRGNDSYVWHGHSFLLIRQQGNNQ